MATNSCNITNEHHHHGKHVCYHDDEEHQQQHELQDEEHQRNMFVKIILMITLAIIIICGFLSMSVIGLMCVVDINQYKMCPSMFVCIIIAIIGSTPFIMILFIFFYNSIFFLLKCKKNPTKQEINI